MFVSILLSFIVVAFNTANSKTEGSNSSWYVGCYKIDKLRPWMKIDITDVTSLRNASVNCRLQGQGYNYLLMMRDSGSCVSSLTNIERTTPSVCDIRCNGSLYALPVRCGSTKHGYASVYHTLGPYLTGLSVDVIASHIVTDQRVTLQATAHMAAYRNITNDGNFGGSSLRFVFEWIVDLTTVNTVTVDSESAIFYSSIPFTFSSTKLYTVEVKVHNLISSYSYKLTVTPILPAPLDLQVSISGDRQPSCIPHEPLFDKNSKTLAVFVNETSHLEVSVAVGVNLTFVTYFSDTREIFTREPDNDDLNCMDSNCTDLKQEHIFHRTGEYFVQVSVSNQYDTLQQNITVIVVNHRLSNLTFSRKFSDSSYIAVGTKVAFLVAIETASRYDTMLNVSFGFDSYLYAVRVENMTGNTSTNSDHIIIIASYGVGCVLEMELTHIFRTEGNFQPHAVASNGVSYLSSFCGCDLNVINDLFEPRLEFNKVVAVNESTLICLKLSRTSKLLDVKWMIMSRLSNSSKTITSNESTLNFTFTYADVYQIHVNVSNPINSVSISASIKVQEVIAGLNLQCYNPIFMSTNQDVVCSANVNAGSNVVFHWTFGVIKHSTDDAAAEFSLNSTVRHTVPNPGTYNISVTASNDLGSSTVYLPHLVNVQEKIGRVLIRGNRSVLTNENVEICAIVTSGSDYRVEFDCGSGRQIVPLNNFSSYCIAHNFTSPGVRNVTVYAENKISMSQSVFPVVVEHDIGDVQVKLIRDCVVNEPAQFAIVIPKDTSTRIDLYYVLTVEGGERVESVNPLITVVFNQSGQHNLTFTIYNRVKLVQRHIHVNVLDRPQLVTVDHVTAATLNELVNFTLKTTKTIYSASITYNGKSESSHQIYTESWVHTFRKAGVHALSIAIYLSDGRQSLIETRLSVDETVTLASVSGPQLLALHKSSNNETWWVHTPGGTGITYRWRLDDWTWYSTRYPLFTSMVQTPGTHNITVLATNSISSAQTSLTFYAQHPMVKMTVRVDPVVRGNASVIILMIHGGADFNISINYGDGTRENITSSNLHSNATSFTRRLNMKPVRSSIRSSIFPIYKLTITHVYRRIGDYLIRFNISNLLSGLSDKVTAKVEEPITGVVVTSESPQILSVQGDTYVTVRVTVATGNNLKFKWDFGDNNNIYRYSSKKLNDRTQEAKHQYKTIIGTYNVTVFVSNDLYSNPVVARLASPFKVMEHIKSPTITLPSTSVKFIETDIGKWESESTTIKASCREGSHASFTIVFGDGTNTTVPGETVNVDDIYGFVDTYMEAAAQHVYDKEGNYTVSVIIANAFGSVRHVSPSLLRVAVPPAGISLDQNKYTTLLGNVTTFHLTIDQGSNLIIEWELGDESTVITQNKTVSHMYRYTGDFNVVVKASLYDWMVKTECEVYVRRNIQGVLVYQLKPTPEANVTTIIATGDSVQYKAMAYPSVGTNLVDYYVWNIGGKNKANAYHAEIRHTFHRHGMYPVTATAHNKLSNSVSAPVMIRVVSPIRTIFIDYDGTPVLYETLRFVLYTPEGMSDFTLTWDFGDGSPTVTTNGNNIYHIYNSTGAFNVKAYVVNPISEGNATHVVFILHEICLPPTIILYPKKKKVPTATLR